MWINFSFKGTAGIIQVKIFMSLWWNCHILSVWPVALSKQQLLEKCTQEMWQYCGKWNFCILATRFFPPLLHLPHSCRMWDFCISCKFIVKWGAFLTWQKLCKHAVTNTLNWYKRWNHDCQHYYYDGFFLNIGFKYLHEISIR